jgi:hypothetical protein
MKKNWNGTISSEIPARINSINPHRTTSSSNKPQKPFTARKSPHPGVPKNRRRTTLTIPSSANKRGDNNVKRPPLTDPRESLIKQKGN